MKRLIILLALTGVPAAAGAQDFGVMETARTTIPGVLIFKAHPMIVFGEDGADNAFGISVLAGYGFASNFDVEFGAAIYDDVSFVGGSAKLWLVEDQRFDVAVSAGLHLGRGEFLDTSGFDVAVIGSTPLTSRLTFFGALDLAVDSIDDDDDNGDSFKTLHLVPGIEYRISDDLSVLTEIGVGLSDDAGNYLAAGVAYYLR